MTSKVFSFFSYWYSRIVHRKRLKIQYRIGQKVKLVQNFNYPNSLSIGKIFTITQIQPHYKDSIYIERIHNENRIRGWINKLEIQPNNTNTKTQQLKKRLLEGQTQ